MPAAKIISNFRSPAPRPPMEKKTYRKIKIKKTVRHRLPIFSSAYVPSIVEWKNKTELILTVTSRIRMMFGILFVLTSTRTVIKRSTKDIGSNNSSIKSPPYFFAHEFKPIIFFYFGFVNRFSKNNLFLLKIYI